MTLPRFNFAVQDNGGNIVDGATVTVTLVAVGFPLATIYSDRDGLVPLANPYVATSGADPGFYAASGFYNVQVVSGSLTRTWNDVGLSIFTPATSAELAAALLDETGTGLAVFNTDPLLTRPIIGHLGHIADGNGNERIIFVTTAGAVNELTLTNAATGTNPQIAASGGDSNVGLDFQVKGTGTYNFLGTASGPADIRLFEDTDNGTNYVSLIAPASLGSSRVLTLPDATDTLVGKATTDALTNKTYNGLTLTTTTGTFTLTNGKTLSVSNTLTLTGTDGSSVAFGTGGTVVYTTGAQTLASKTLTSPKIVSGDFIADANGNELIIFTTTASAVNEITITNAATATRPRIEATGSDANIGIDFQVKGSAVYNFLATSSGPTDIRWYEDTDNGTNSISLKAPSSLASNQTLTWPDATDTLVGKATTDTLTNKTFDTAGSGNVFKIASSSITGISGSGTNVVLSSAPAIAGGTITALTTLALRDTSAAFDLTLAAVSSTALTAGRTLTLDMVNAARTIKLQGNLDIGGNLTTATNTSLPVIAQGDLWYASATGIMSALAKDTNATRYLSNQGTSNIPSWNQVNLANGVTGDLPFANLTQIAAYSLLGNTTGSTADVAGFTVGGLTQKASPAASDLVLLQDQAASGALKYATVSSLASAGSVASIAGNTGAFTLSQGLTNSTNDLRIDWSYLQNYLSGLGLSYASTTTFTVAAGVAADSTNATGLKLASALTKSTSAWAVGTGNGGIDTGAIAATTWYHVWLIRRSDTGVVDALFSTSASAPTMPSNYDSKRRIGSVKTNGSSQFIQWVANGDYFAWATPTADHDITNPGTSAVTRTVSVPTGVKVLAKLAVAGRADSASDNPAGIYISDLALTDVSPAANTAFSVETNHQSITGVDITGSEVTVTTDTSAQVRTRVQGSGATTHLYIDTLGWFDRRGRDG